MTHLVAKRRARPWNARDIWCTRQYWQDYITTARAIRRKRSAPVELTTFFCFSHFYFPASGQTMVTGVIPSRPRFWPSIFIAHRVKQSHCSSIFHRVLLTPAVALSASQFVHKKKSPRIYTSMHSGGRELTKLTYTRLEDDLMRHRGDRLPNIRYQVYDRSPSLANY